MSLVALAAPTVVFLLALRVLRAQRPGRPAALAAPLAVAVTVCFEALLLDALSLFHGVARTPLLVAHGAVALGLAGSYLGPAGAKRLRAPSRRAGGADAAGASLLLIALAAPIAYSALCYVPNNWDSMTYHLARVAHWLQHRSVASYPTSVARQVTYPPGAEYVVLVLQAISGTDRLASLVQLASWVVTARAAAPLARTFGAPRRLAPWAALLFAAAPMAVLQASSTQNDLVASAVAAGIVVACVPFLHRRPRWRGADAVTAALALTAGVLVKPTALVAALPFVTWAAVAGARGVAAGGARRAGRARGLALGLAVAAALLAPEGARRLGSADHGEFGPYLYRPLSDGADRAVNALRAVARHVPLPAAWTAALAPAATKGCATPGSLCTEGALRAHEDVAGNPAAALVTAALLAAAVARRSSPARARAASAALLAAWLCFAAVFRDNVWIARLHLPLFALAPIAAAALGGVSWGSRLRWTARAAGIVVALLGARAAFRNELRRVPNEVGASFGLMPWSYYAARPEQWTRHVQAMEALRETRCSRVGLYIGGDSYDYPLTWRAMQRGAEVRHVTGPDDWPCVVYSDRGAPPPPPAGAWCAVAGAPEVFVRGAPGAAGCAALSAAR